MHLDYVEQGHLCYADIHMAKLHLRVCYTIIMSPAINNGLSVQILHGEGFEIFFDRALPRLDPRATSSTGLPAKPDTRDCRNPWARRPLSATTEHN
jgi:hypothetical protein